MKKRIKKIVSATLLFLLTFISGIITLVLYPQPLFANKLEYKNFSVYSNDIISADIKIVLDNAKNLVQKSELNDDCYKYDILFCYNSVFNTIDDRILGKGPAARATGNNVVVKVRVDSKLNLGYSTFRKPCEVDLTQLIAHEMIHCLQANKYGRLKFNPVIHPALWKLEGYPEYIMWNKKLSGKEYSLVKEISRYIDLDKETSDMWIVGSEGGCEVPKYYLKGRLMMEYLMNIRHFSYDQILSDTTTENAIYSAMIKWKDSTETINSTKVRK